MSTKTPDWKRGATPQPPQPPQADASGHEPDAGRSVQREAQDDVLATAAHRESWLAQIWRAVRGSTGRPTRTHKT